MCTIATDNPPRASLASDLHSRLAPLAPQGFYRRSGKRILDVVGSSVALLLLSPLFLIVMMLEKLTSRSAVFYSQERVGRGGQLFRIFKFRSMVLNADAIGPAVTSAGDARITRLGQLLRRWKLDELPQLWNVLRGDMSLVGPRPEVALYVAGYSIQERQVLTIRPGITDIASIVYRNEENILSQSPNPEHYYREVVLPHKLALNVDYLNNMSLIFDLLLILKTAMHLFSLLESKGK